MVGRYHRRNQRLKITTQKGGNRRFNPTRKRRIQAHRKQI